MSSPAKKPRRDAKSKDWYVKQARKATNSLEAGQKGFLVTCNFKERDAIREVYRLLNEYHNKESTVTQSEVEKPDEDNDDITSQLQSQIDKTKQENKERAHKFQAIDTGVQNCLFVKCSIDDLDVLKLGSDIVRDLAETKIKKTRVTLRMLPIEIVCKAKMQDITDAAGPLFDKHFLKEPSTFAINFNKRYNQDIQRDDVIKELAELIAMKNPNNKVNLKDPQQSVIIEVIKGRRPSTKFKDSLN